MTLQYHGWIALATSQNDWSDGDFEEANRRVRETLKSLNAEDGHDPNMPDCTVLPQMVYLKGVGAPSLQPVVRVIENIGSVFDDAYGELSVIREDRKEHGDWELSRVRRYHLVCGKISEE